VERSVFFSWMSWLGKALGMVLSYVNGMACEYPMPWVCSSALTAYAFKCPYPHTRPQGARYWGLRWASRRCELGNDATGRCCRVKRCSGALPVFPCFSYSPPRSIPSPRCWRVVWRGAAGNLARILKL
jgi:hypothetical protein